VNGKLCKEEVMAKYSTIASFTWRDLGCLLTGKVVPVHVMNTYRGRTGIALLILYLVTEWSWWVVNFMSRPLYLQERTLMPLE
jgi:hypothetical protein